MAQNFLLWLLYYFRFMIKHVPYHQIDKNKYDYCIHHSFESRIYAYSWYLDSVTKCWDVMMEGDYESVMPIPRKTKYGMPYVYTPSWVQQLGLFSLNKSSENLQKEFLKSISKKFLWIDYQMNSDNFGIAGSALIKRNYLLSIKGGIDDIQANYNKNRKRISRKIIDDLILDKNGDLDVFIENYMNQHKPYDISEESIAQLECLCRNNKDHVHIWNVFIKEEFMAGLVWLKDSHRITYLAPLAGERGKKLHIPTYLINTLINDFQGQNLVLDFEGSMVSGVENFYKSFGAKAESYYYFKKRFIDHV